MAVVTLLGSGAALDVVDGLTDAFLHTAARNGLVRVVATLHEDLGGAVNMRDAFGLTPSTARWPAATVTTWRRCATRAPSSSLQTKAARRPCTGQPTRVSVAALC